MAATSFSMEATSLLIFLASTSIALANALPLC
jgi:hypothetical protein